MKKVPFVTIEMNESKIPPKKHGNMLKENALMVAKRMSAQ